MRDLEMFALWYCLFAAVLAFAIVIFPLVYEPKKRGSAHDKDSKISKVKE